MRPVESDHPWWGGTTISIALTPRSGITSATPPSPPRSPSPLAFALMLVPEHRVPQRDA